MHLQDNTLFDLWPWSFNQGHRKCCSVPSTSNDLCHCKIWSCYVPQLKSLDGFTRKTLFDLFDLNPKVTQYVTQYPLHHVTYGPAKFQVAMCEGFGADAFTRKCIIWPWPQTMCHAQGHNAVTLDRLEPAIPRSWVKHFTTEPLRSQSQSCEQSSSSFHFILRQLVSSADDHANSLDPDQAWQNVRPDLDPNCLTLWWYSWKNFSKKMILKKKSADNKSMQNYPVGKVCSAYFIGNKNIFRDIGI